MKKVRFFFSILIIFLIINPYVSSENLLSDYKISAGDVISINIYPATEFSRDVTVSPDGSIDMPLLGSIKVSGLRAFEVERIITERLSKYVSNPKVTVAIKIFSSYRVAIIGSIQRSGYYQYRENMNILELIAEAGGLQDYADTKNIKIYRKIRDDSGNLREIVIKISIEDFFENSQSIKPLEVGDIVYIPRQKFTSKSKWISDNIVPWITLTTFFISIGVILSR
ncbi:MAG: polysaccharide biosynthesis/export family protein [Elusimicrobiales bacterium]